MIVVNALKGIENVVISTFFSCHSVVKFLQRIFYSNCSCTLVHCAQLEELLNLVLLLILRSQSYPKVAKASTH